MKPPSVAVGVLAGALLGVVIAEAQLYPRRQTPSVEIIGADGGKTTVYGPFPGKRDGGVYFR